MIKGVGISSREKFEFELVKKMIKECDSNIKCYHFNEIIHTPELLNEIDFLLTIGGDGSVAWLVGTFYKAFDSIEKIKPIIPVVRKESVGYLKQIDLDPSLFKEGFMKLLKGEYEVIQRTVLKAIVSENNGKNISVNEVMMSCSPHLGKFTVTIIKDGNKEIIAEIFADAVLIVTSIGSTAWALSYGGFLNLDEDSLEIIFIGAMHGGASYIIPKKGKLHINLELKNPVITEDTVIAYNQARVAQNLPLDPISRDSLSIFFSSQIIVDGKLVNFGSTDVEIDPSYSIPFVFIKDHSIYDKARQLTKNTKSIW